MPYIEDNEKRRSLDRLSQLVANSIIKGGEVQDGQLNYFICRLLINLNPESYSDHKSNIGDIREALHEYRRKVVVPYENKKEKENGTVWVKKMMKRL